MSLFTLEPKSGPEQFRSNATGDVIVAKKGHAAIITHVDANMDGPVYVGIVIESSVASSVGSEVVILDREVAYRRS